MPKNQEPTLEEFTTALSRRFGGQERSIVYRKLAAIRKHEMIEDYIQEFELLVSQVTQTSEGQLAGVFFCGITVEHSKSDSTT